MKYSFKKFKQESRIPYVVLYTLIIFIVGLILALIIQLLGHSQNTLFSGAAASITGAISIVSVAFVLVQLKASDETRRRDVDIRQSQLYHNFADRWLSTDKYLMDHADLHPYFYDKEAVLPERDTVEFSRIMAMCEYLEDMQLYLEGEIEKDCVMGSSYIPEEQRLSYRIYFLNLYNSPAFQAYYREYGWINSEKGLENNEQLLEIYQKRLKLLAGDKNRQMIEEETRRLEEDRKNILGK